MNHINQIKFIHKIGTLFLLVTLLSSCNQSSDTGGTPLIRATNVQLIEPERSLPALTEEPDILKTDRLATQQAALEKSGKSGPELPTGILPIKPVENPTNSYEQQNTVGSQQGTVSQDKVNATPQESVPTLSHEEIATREARLAGSGKSGQVSP